MNPKTPETRAHELFKLVHGSGDSGSVYTFQMQNPAIIQGWLKLGKLVLKLERKFNKAARP